MERQMSAHDPKLAFFIANERRLTPAHHKGLWRWAIERARSLRAGYLHDLWQRVVAWYQARAAVAQLRGLDDAALKDIGLHRSGIEAAVSSHAAKRERREPRAFAEKPHFCLQRVG